MSNESFSALPNAADPNRFFPPTSRYHGIKVATTPGADGRIIAYVGRRFVPSPDRFDLLEQHSVVQGDRLDNLAAKYLGDPEQFWRVCDANNALRPDALTETPGRKLRLTLPEGVPGSSHA